MSQKSKKSTGLHHVCLRVSNPIETTEFYQSAFGAAKIAEWGDIENGSYGALIDLGGGDLIEVFDSGAAKPGCLWQHIAVRTQDIEKSYSQAHIAGALPHSEPKYHEIQASAGNIIRMKFAFVQSLGGELIEFIEEII